MDEADLHTLDRGGARLDRRDDLERLTHELDIVNGSSLKPNSIESRSEGFDAVETDQPPANESANDWMDYRLLSHNSRRLESENAIVTGGADQ